MTTDNFLKQQGNRMLDIIISSPLELAYNMNMNKHMNHWPAVIIIKYLLIYALRQIITTDRVLEETFSGETVQI